MSKAILVEDMPVRCADCPLRCSIIQIPFCFKTCQQISDDEYYNKKPEWCPLRELPEKFLTTGEQWVEGYNACIDEILKGSEENGKS